MTDYKIVRKRESPENGATQIHLYDIKVEINGETFEKGFNLDPDQDIDSHVQRWIKTLK